MNQPSTAREPIQILVLCDSLTGNVETMARLVVEGAQEIRGTEVRVTRSSLMVPYEPPLTMCCGPMESP